jgi:hypothetical protein
MQYKMIVAAVPRNRAYREWYALVLFVVFLLPTLLFPLHLQQHATANIANDASVVTTAVTLPFDTNCSIATAQHHHLQHEHCALCDQFLHQDFQGINNWFAILFTTVTPCALLPQIPNFGTRAQVISQNKSPPC